MFEGKRQSFGTALYYLNNHRITWKRYLQTFYPVYDWGIITSFFYKNPIQAKVIVDDFQKSNDHKLEDLIKIFIYGKSKIVYVVGARNCLPKGTLVRTQNGYLPIERVDKVMSYNFQKRKLEKKQGQVFGPIKKKVWKINTSEGVLKCSGEHKWFVERDGKIIVIPTNEINSNTDKLLQSNRLILNKIIIHSIKETEEETEMYDLEVEDNHNFLLRNNIITHNSGKTATAFMVAEQTHIATNRHIYYVAPKTTNQQALPEWCKICESIQKVPKGAFAIVDESAIQFNAREYMDKENIDMTKLLVIARHKDIFLIFLTQDTELADTNIRRLRDMILWKKSNNYSLSERGDKRTPEAKFWQKVRNMMAPRKQNQCLFEYPAERRFIHFEHDLPECWSNSLSKMWQSKSFGDEEKDIRTEPKKVKREVIVLKG